MASDLLTTLKIEGREYQFYDVSKIGSKYLELPYCLRIWFESVIRNSELVQDQDVAKVWTKVAEALLDENRDDRPEYLFQPGRVILQDFTGLAALIDLASIRDEVAKRGGNPEQVDAQCPADVVIDHCVQVDYSQIESAIDKEANDESNLVKLFCNLSTANPPPGAMIVHSTFPPPPPMHFFLPSPPPPPAAAAAASFYPPFCAQIPPPITPPPPQAAQFMASSLRNGGGSKVPKDNPGLPVQEDVCPFHQRISYWSSQLQKNRSFELDRNEERFQFLKWVDYAFSRVTVIPPGTGVMHKVNLEYLARVVTCKERDGKTLLFPDSLIGTDAHTTVVNGLGVLGWSVGTLEAESVMFGHPVTLRLPRVVGVELKGDIPHLATATDIVLMVTKELRTHNFKGDIFVEFFGPGIKTLSVSDRSAIANMCSEYGALIGFFPMDAQTIDYLSFTGRDTHQLKCIETYMKKVSLFRHSNNENVCKYDQVVSIDFEKIVPSVSGPQSSTEKMPLSTLSQHFRKMIRSRFPQTYLPGMGHDEFPIVGTSFNINVGGRYFTIGNGTILMASIASCSNASNPSVMLSAGLLAKKAVEAGLSVARFVRQSLCPGSGIVTSYLQESGVMPYLHMLGFEVMGYGCSACVENSSKPVLAESENLLIESIRQRSLTCVGVMSGNRNFEGRKNPDIKAHYLVSPQLVIAFAIAGRIDIDFMNEPLGVSSSNNLPVYLQDIWPSKEEVETVEHRFVIPAIFRQVPTRLAFGTKEWSQIEIPQTSSGVFKWDPISTFIRSPGYIPEMIQNPNKSEELKKMRCIVKLGDGISSDFISPAGSIVRNSPAADYLKDQGVSTRDYGSYGSRRGNWEVMGRGTLAHPKLRNLLVSKTGAYTVHLPSGVPTSIFDASQMYEKEGVKTLVLAGDNFGRGAARDWATKGLYIIGVRAVIATSFHSNFRANLVKVGILPVKIDRQFFDKLNGREEYELGLPEDGSFSPKSEVRILVGGSFLCNAEAQLENEYEVKLFKDGGIICQTANSMK